MTDAHRSPSSLAWRVALTAVIVRLIYSVLVQGYTVYALPQSDQLRQMYSQPQFLTPLLATIAASVAIAGLAAWGAMHQWLRRHNTTAVDEPRKLFGTFIALQLIYTLAVSAAMAVLHGGLMRYIIDNRDSLTDTFGLSVTNQFLASGLFIKVLTIVLEILGMYLVVRIATWTVAPAGPAGAPHYDRRHAAWITGVTLLIWQLSVSIALAGYLPMHMLGAGWLEYLLGYLALPAGLLVLCAQTCFKSLPRQIGSAGIGRAVAHGSFTFWLTQLLGIGMGFLAIQTMSWGQLMRASESHVTTAALLLIYGALLVLACVVGKQVLYPTAKMQTQTPGR